MGIISAKSMAPQTKMIDSFIVHVIVECRKLFIYPQAVEKLCTTDCGQLKAGVTAFARVFEKLSTISCGIPVENY